LLEVQAAACGPPFLLKKIFAIVLIKLYNVIENVTGIVFNKYIRVITLKDEGKITIKDIADRAGVSVSTVSRVLNEKPDVNEETRTEVLQIIEDVNYRPNNVARSLVLDQTHSLGLIVPDINNPFFTEVARGLEDTAQQHGYSVIFSSTDNRADREKKRIELMRQKQVDGMILALSIRNLEVLNRLQEADFPAVQLDRNIPGSDYPAVMVGNQRSAVRAVEYLLSLGYEKIAHISGNLSTYPGLQRRDGFITALDENGVDVPPEYFREGNFSQRSGCRKMKELLQLSDPPEAVFAANDMMALGAYQACNEADLDIPGDIAIMGHDNIRVAELVDPPLTTMGQPKYSLGQLACQKLLELIEYRRENQTLDLSEFDGREVLETELIERQSTREESGDAGK